MQESSRPIPISRKKSKSDRQDDSEEARIANDGDDEDSNDDTKAGAKLREAPPLLVNIPSDPYDDSIRHNTGLGPPESCSELSPKTPETPALWSYYDHSFDLPDDKMMKQQTLTLPEHLYMCPVPKESRMKANFMSSAHQVSELKIHVNRV